MNLQTTLNIIRAAKPCADGWEKLLKSLPADIDHDAPISFLHILESNGLHDALWALRCVLPSQEKQRDCEARLFACDCAESVLHIFEAKFPDDKRPRACIETARRFAFGDATMAELATARAAARDATAAWGASAASAASAATAAWAASAARAAENDKQKAQFITRFCTQEASK